MPKGVYQRKEDIHAGSSNPNWNGGISLVRYADEILSLSDGTIEEIYHRFTTLYHIDNESGCWVWTGGVFKKNGRAKLVLGTNLLASRVSYVLYKGLTGEMCVLHTCDNVLCVNPDHLWLGTNADNSADMVVKGRSAPQHGTLNPRALLTEEIVGVVKVRLRNGERQNKIAVELGVCKATINNIATGRAWRHVI